MANNHPGIVSQAVQLAYNIANRHHVLSKVVPLGLFALDAVLCALIIWKVPCEWLPRLPFDRMLGSQLSRQ
jgi:alpha-1,3-mannosyltransferase